jgi:CheY-like chemotaxis protein
MSKAPVDQQAEVFKAYIQDKKILLADTSGVSRGSMANLLVTMGARQANIALASSFADAEQEILRIKPKIVICDYDLGTRCGLELIQKQREHHPESRDTLFILVTGNTSQTAVARAAEEDVDTYILKPFTQNVVRMSIIRAALAKSSPGPYVRAINEGKELLVRGKLDEAKLAFERAKKLDPAPSLACFYVGQVNLMKEALKQAEGSYQEGLDYNKIHYKCMVGLFEILMQQKLYTEAYEIVKKISQYFPANPQRLNSVLKLAIVTKSYDDVERYYQTFTKIDERNEDLIKHVCAALVVCGKYYLAAGFKSRASELFKKAAATASGRQNILREIIIALVEAGLPREAQEYLGRFPPELQSSGAFLALDFLIMDRLAANFALPIDRGRELLAREVNDPLVFHVLLRRNIEAGLMPAAEQLLDDAVKNWPDQRGEFVKVMNAAVAASKDRKK